MTDVVMPQMGESIVEGTLTKWLKKPGERIERDEPLFEISTDKVDTEIPSPAAGTLAEILVEEGKTVGINTIVARIDEGGRRCEARGSASPPRRRPPPPAAPLPAPPRLPLRRRPPRRSQPKPAPSAGTRGACRSAVSAGAQDGARTESRPGAGEGHRRGRPDHQAGRGGIRGRRKSQPAAPAAAAGAAPPRPPLPQRPPRRPPMAPLPPAGQAKTRIEPMSTMRIKIAEHMVMSKRTSPHVTTIHRVDMTKVAKMRERHKAQFQAAYGFGLTYLPFITRAAVAGLRQYPLLNASLDNNNIIYHNEIHIGIAVALENGLIVPVIRGADEKNVLGLQRSIVDLAARARSRQLKPDEVTGGTFSITNFGSFGSLIGTPVINQPQVAIMGVGTVDKTPVVIDDAIAIRSICHLSLSFDHRLIDGALADQFMTKVKQVLENWSEEVL